MYFVIIFAAEYVIYRRDYAKPLNVDESSV